MSKNVYLALFGIFYFLKLIYLHSEYKDPKQQKVIIAGVCKNISVAVHHTIDSIERLGSQFKDYRVIIYENNSEDNTVPVLTNWAMKNKKVVFITEYLSSTQLYNLVNVRKELHSLSREELIARARNVVLEEAMKPIYDDYPYFIMADLDFIIPWEVEEIANTLNVDEEWDAICANGLDLYGFMYDRYAYRDSKFPLGPEITGMEWWKKDITANRVRIELSDSLLPVYSAFGGLAIYKRGSIYDCLYSGVVTEDLGSYLKKILLNTPDDNEHAKRCLGLNIIRDGAIHFPWEDSHRSNRPVCCEHFTFHAAMAMKGHDKIFVRPKMTLQYDCSY